MKRKLIIALIFALSVFCLLAVGVSATEINYSEKATLHDNTVLPIYNEENEGLIWFITSTDENGVNTYASVAANQTTKVDGESYVSYSTQNYGKIQLKGITVHYYNGSEYVDITKVVVCNLRDISLSYDHFNGSIMSTYGEYLYHSSTCIDAGKFDGNTVIQLVDFSLATTVEAFSAKAFNGCTSLREMRLPKTEKSYELSCSNYHLFENCTSLTYLYIPSSVTYIQDSAFNGCTSLNVEFEDISTITYLGDTAFQNCHALSGTFEFSGITEVKKYTFRYAATNEGCELILKFPNVTQIGTGAQDGHAFSYSGVKEVYIGGAITWWGYNNFTDCKKLEIVQVDRVASGFNFNGYTFENCSALKAFSVPEGVTALPSRMFKYCTSLTAVYLPSTLTAINSGDNDFATFKGCTSLYFVSEPFYGRNIPAEPQVYSFPTGLTVLSGEAFDNSRINDVVVLPSGITSLTQGYTFEGCSSKSGKPTVVFMGDMTAVTAKSWGVNAIYFANANDKDAASASFSGSITTYYCLASGNTNHLFLVEKNVLPTCTEAGVLGYTCFCGTASADSEVIPAKGHTRGETVSSAFKDANGAPNYFENMVSICVCSVCNQNAEFEDKDTALFTSKGYSFSKFDSSAISYTIYVNHSAIEKYGVDIKYGIVVSAKANGTPISLENGEIAVGEKTVLMGVENSEYKYSILQAKITNIGEGKLLHCNAYVVENEAITYLGHDVSNVKAEVISYDYLMQNYDPEEDL